MTEPHGQVEALKRLVVALVLAHGERIDGSGDGFTLDIPPAALLNSHDWVLYEVPMAFDGGMGAVVARSTVVRSGG